MDISLGWSLNDMEESYYNNNNTGNHYLLGDPFISFLDDNNDNGGSSRDTAGDDDDGMPLQNPLSFVITVPALPKQQQQQHRETTASTDPEEVNDSGSEYLDVMSIPADSGEEEYVPEPSAAAVRKRPQRVPASRGITKKAASSGRRKVPGVIYHTTKLPVVAALLEAVSRGKGAEFLAFTPDRVHVRVWDAPMLMAAIDAYNTKPNPTRDMAARRKALIRWFSGLPEIKDCARPGHDSVHMTATNAQRRGGVVDAARKLYQLAKDCRIHITLARPA
jgi:hypothetical protein